MFVGGIFGRALERLQLSKCECFSATVKLPTSRFERGNGRASGHVLCLMRHIRGFVTGQRRLRGAHARNAMHVRARHFRRPRAAPPPKLDAVHETCVGATHAYYWQWAGRSACISPVGAVACAVSRLPLMCGC